MHNKLTGPELRRLREAAGLTQEQLAAQVGISSTTISRAERGISKFHPLTERAIMEALETLKR